MHQRQVVAVPFQIAAGFLLLLFLWGFGLEESEMSNPVKYEYEHFKKNETLIEGELKHGSYMPWKSSVAGRTMHLDTDAIIVGDRVELHGLATRKDLNGVSGRILAFDGRHYTVRLKHGIGKFQLKPKNVKLYAAASTAEGLAAELATDSRAAELSASTSPNGAPVLLPKHEVLQAKKGVEALTQQALAQPRLAGHHKPAGGVRGAAAGDRGATGAPAVDPWVISVALLLFGCVAAARLAPILPAPPSQRLSIKAAPPPRRLLMARTMQANEKRGEATDAGKDEGKRMNAVGKLGATTCATGASSPSEDSFGASEEDRAKSAPNDVEAGLPSGGAHSQSNGIAGTASPISVRSESNGGAVEGASEATATLVVPNQPSSMPTPPSIPTSGAEAARREARD